MSLNTLIVFPKETFEKDKFVKKLADNNKSMKNYKRRQRVKLRTLQTLKGKLRNEFNFGKVHGNMNMLGLLQSK